MNTTLLPYIYFNGRCAEAVKFYQSVLGGELLMQTYAEAGMPTPDPFKNNIMHAELKNGPLSLMASDGSPGNPVKVGDNIQLSVVGSDQAKLTEYFSKLSAGGSIDMPLEKQMWGDVFGMLTDKFGVRWMFNISAAGQS